VTLGELSNRLSRADFLDGFGIYVGTHEVALAHVAKRFFKVVLRQAHSFPLPASDRPAERRQALAQAVLTFVRDHKVDTRRTYLCLPRAEAFFNRVLLPAAARENLSQVLEYEIEHLVPLPRDQLYFDYSVRPMGGERIEVLLMCIPRDVVQSYLGALEDAFVRPRGIVLASTAIADYLAFCRGESERPVGLLLASNQAVELALLSGGRLVASQLMPASRVTAPADLSRSLAREMADGFVAPEDVDLFRWELVNGSGPTLPSLGDPDLIALAVGRLTASAEFFDGGDPAVLPAVGAALDAVREGNVPVNLLPAEDRRAHEEGLSLTTIVLVALMGVLLLVWGSSAIVKDELLVRQVRQHLEAVSPQVREAKTIQDEIVNLRSQIDVLTNEAQRVTVIMKELSELIPPDAYLTSLNLRAGKLTLDGFARSASDLIAALEKSKHFKNVNFTSPTTRSGDKERFSLVAEVER
jgi:general secretion pathway protein L